MDRCSRVPRRRFQHFRKLDWLAKLVTPKAPTTDTIAAGLSVPGRVLLLFCLASGTDWLKAGVP
jgi:hypothetical protein